MELTNVQQSMWLLGMLATCHSQEKGLSAFGSMNLYTPSREPLFACRKQKTFARGDRDRRSPNTPRVPRSQRHLAYLSAANDR